ncbi:efflux RND transporter periplasmic adaptor subunit [Putridiphycobacter roseus]|nr:efflux RND transporter periplasmic adaptor subunit [Putridiphycobacter roseus]
MQKKRVRSIIIWSIVVILLGLFVYKQFIQKDPVYIAIQKEVTLEETLYAEVSATGTINPIELVDVGTQVSGIISEILVDFNDRVKSGQVLARMDKRILTSSLKESRSNLLKAEVTLKQSKRELDRNTKLFSKGFIAEIELENAQYDFDNAEATYNVAKLQLDKNEVNLGYANIVSPIDGIVISKNIDVGQTIAASFTTPILFSIANDLKQMKIEASVDEADIGMVKPGQKVFFTVDAFPEDLFEGVVKQVQLEPTVIQNVVTYNVIVIIQNPDLKLMPGMTATLIIRTKENPVSLAVPNAALSFFPSEEDIKQLNKKHFKIEALNQTDKSTVWVINEQKMSEKSVLVNFTNGIRSAISGELNAGDSVITNINMTIGEKKSGSFFSENKEEK